MSKNQWHDHKVNGFNYKKLPVEAQTLKIVGVNEKEGEKGSYLLFTARNINDNSMPSVRATIATLWRYDQLIVACGLSKVGDPGELMGLTFNATLVAHKNPNGGNTFIDVDQYK